MKAPPPTISVVMPVYNAASYLARAVESILTQTFPDFELLAVDDGSTDRSLSILQHYAQLDSRIVLISRPNTGIVGALNDGLAAAHGAYVARMDGDDVASPGRFEQQLAFLEDEPDCVALGTAILFTDPEGRPLKPYRPPTHHDAIEAELAQGNGGALIHPSVLFRREALLACGGYRPQYNFIEDLDLYVRLLRVGRLANLPEILLAYRQHPGSVNHVVGDRSRQVAEIIAPLRREKGLPLLPAEALPQYAALPSGPAACRRQWALDAAEGGNLAAAWANALRAVAYNPFASSNWGCLRYVHGLRRTAQPPPPPEGINTPVVFLVFNRPDLTRRVFERIREARPPELFLVCDGPRAHVPADAENVAQVRAFLETGVDWPCTVHRDFSQTNLGCRRRVASGLDWVFSQVEEAIILEDDCLPDPSFFTFCDAMLARYRYDPRILHINGTSFLPSGSRVRDSYFFSKHVWVWGWATWRRAWRQYDPLMETWDERLPHLEASFDTRRERAFWLSTFSEARADWDKTNTWDFQWFYTCWTLGGLTVVPAVNLIENIGFGVAATHTTHDQPHHRLRAAPLAVKRHPARAERNRLRDSLITSAYLGEPIHWRTRVIVLLRYLHQRLLELFVYFFRP
ncbi:MAG: glycosyltransferase [Verrucomicrobiota bacterium]